MSGLNNFNLIRRVKLFSPLFSVGGVEMNGIQLITWTFSESNRTENRFSQKDRNQTHSLAMWSVLFRFSRALRRPNAFKWWSLCDVVYCVDWYALIYQRQLKMKCARSASRFGGWRKAIVIYLKFEWIMKSGIYLRSGG